LYANKLGTIINIKKSTTLQLILMIQNIINYIIKCVKYTIRKSVYALYYSLYYNVLQHMSINNKQK